MDDPWDAEGKLTSTGRSFNDNFNWTTALENAQAGDADYQYKLGVWHLDGGNQFVEKDREEAVKWLTKAAEQGHKEAKKRLVELKDDKKENVVESEYSYDIMINAADELLFCIRDREGEPFDPVILYSGGTNAILLRRPDQFILLDEVNPDIRKPLSKAKDVLIAEFVLTNKDRAPEPKKDRMAREYHAKIHTVTESLESEESIEGLLKNGDPLKRSKDYLEDDSDWPDPHEICP